MAIARSLMALAGAVLALGAVAAPNWHGCIDAKAVHLPYCDVALPLEKRLDDLMSRLSLEEKVQQITPDKSLGDACTTFTTGKVDIGLPPWLWLVETNTGVDAACPAENHCVTNFAGPMGMAASFNRSSWHLKGYVLGTEQRALSNIHGSRFHPDHKNPVCLTAFGPNINIVRDPRFGRNSELASEDPVLSGIYATQMVSGMQEKDKQGYKKTAAYLKQYTAYSTEANRGHDTYNISTYDFFDTYPAQYKLAFTAQPTGVMCSYDAENGRPSCANSFILDELRTWNPDAHVTTDCGAVENLKGFPVNAPDDEHAAAMALMNGTDLEMGDSLFLSLPKAIEQGLASSERLDEAVRRAFRVQFHLGRFDPADASTWSKYGLNELNHSRHQQISYEAALQSFVLLRNDGALPIEAGAAIAVLGPHAVSRSGLFSDYAGKSHCFDGSDACVPSIAEGLAMANPQGRVSSSMGVEINSSKTEGIAAALAAAREADAIVLALGDDQSVERETRDRPDTALPGLQTSFAKQVLAIGKPTVIVLVSGGPMAIDDLMGPREHLAIVNAFFPSHKGAQALGMTLMGRENRWGKLPVTMYPHNYISQQQMTNYDMSKAPGRSYKYYQGQPLFPFGYGLSLTTFDFHCQMTTSASSFTSFSCQVRNTGSLDGEEVFQVYHSAINIGEVDHPVPKRSLRDFQRIAVPKSSTRSLPFEVPHSSLQLINKDGKATLYPGEHAIIISRGHADEQKFLIRIGEEIVI